jgi:uncharacterized membrane protein YfcA
MNAILIEVLCINFLATLVRSTFGFGEALVAVPLLSLILPLNVAVPMSVMLSVVIALSVVVQDHKKIDVRSVKWLVISGILGIPVGIAVLLYGNEKLIKTALGILLIGYSIFGLNNKRNFTKNFGSNILWLWLCGFASGVLGGAYGMNGPPLVIYGKIAGWDPKEFRANLQGYFLPVSLISVIGYCVKDVVTTEVLGYFLKSIPVIIPSIYIGRWLNHRIKSESFFSYVYVGLIALGLLAILDTIW